MPQDNPRSDRARNGSPRGDRGRTERPRDEKPSSVTNDVPFNDDGTRSVAFGLHLQKEMLGLLSDMGQDWFARATAEAQLALGLPNRLTAARSIPDAVTAYQEWFGEWVDRCGQDTQRLLSDGQRMFVTGTRSFTGNGKR
jgi:hypothetical protein